MRVGVVRGTVERFAHRAWSGRAGPLGSIVTMALVPLSWLWKGVVGARNARYARGASTVPGLAIVSVGNLAVGGTGKTPVASWVARELVLAGHEVAISVHSRAQDEALLHERWTPQASVHVSRDRLASARKARGEGSTLR